MTMTGKLVHEETAEDWDERFQGGWQSAGGPLQSLNFAFYALRALGPQFEDFRMWSFDPKTLEVSGPGPRIHDYGCALGDGTALLQLAFPLAEVVGIDHSPKGIEEARKRWPHIRFEVGDVNAPEKDADIIWTSHVLEHVPDAAETILRLLKRCRALVVVVPPVSEKSTGGHDGAEPIEEWLKRVPKPFAHAAYNTFRKTPEALVEGNRLFLWRGDLESTDP